MNTKLLREDERNVGMSDIRMAEIIDLLRQRLIEEREKNALFAKRCDRYEGFIVDLEAELAEARKKVSAA